MGFTAKVRVRILAALLPLLGASGERAAATAAEWVSPDGQIAVAQPPQERFTADPAVEPPGLVRWVSSDGTTVIAVIKTAIPSNQPLVQGGLEDGTLTQLKNGRIVSSTSSSPSGVPAYTIVAKGSLAGVDTFLSQVIVAFNGQLYKVMVASPTDPRTDADVGPVLRSLRILHPSPAAPKAAGAAGPSSGRSKSQWERTNEISVEFARWGWWLLLAAGLAVVLRKKTRRPPATATAATPPPLPPAVPTVPPRAGSADRATSDQ